MRVPPRDARRRPAVPGGGRRRPATRRRFQVTLGVMADDHTRRLGEPGPGQPDRDLRRLQPGERVGDWIVVRALAGGGFGTVYEARHRTTDQRAALKLLHAHLSSRPRWSRGSTARRT